MKKVWYRNSALFVLLTLCLIKCVPPVWKYLGTTPEIKKSFAASDTFTSSGTWVAPTGIYAVNILVVAGGGGSGMGTKNTVRNAGGGGGGGLIYMENYSVTPGSDINAVVGGGGAGATATSATGSNGSNSSFGSLTAVGGGGGGSSGNRPGSNGGSGGGAGVLNTSTGTGGTGTQPSQSGDSGTYGFGNNGASSTARTAGGGGGAGGAASGTTGGAGKSVLSGTYASGGNAHSNGASGAANTGNGGNAPATNSGSTGSSGGSGIVIVNYTDTWAPSTNQTTYSPTWSFSSIPYNTSSSQISMTAITGYDYSTPIEFLFTLDNSSCTTNHGGTGGTTSSWQTNTSYSDTGLDANKCYGYYVKARDSLGNSGPSSSLSYTYTSANTPGTPTLDGATYYTLDVENNSNGNPSSDPTTLYAVQVTYANPSDINWEDKWVDGSGYSNSSEVWMSDSDLDNITIKNLQDNTEYGISVKAKNEDGEETSLSTEGRGSTLEFVTYSTFTTSGTWVAPDGINAADVECWGGGGGGGGSTANTSYGGGGGGGGAYSKVNNVTVIPGSEYQVIIGSGGSGGTQNSDGDPGEDSTFETDVLVALGGQGGGVGGSSSGTPGLGGDSESSTGDVLHSGGDGAAGDNPVGGGGGEGSGSTSDGGDAVGQTGGTGTNGGDGGNGGNSNTNGSSGSAPGGGGGGAGDGDSSIGYTGGSGEAGKCIIHYKERVDGTLSCKVTTSCSYGVVAYKMSDLSNAHAELPDQSNYSQVVCCTGVPGLSNLCEGNYQTIIKLSSETNAHVEQNDQTNYSQNACLQAPDNGIIDIGYKVDSCDGYDTVLGSMSSTTNAHIGDENAYPIKICATGLVAGTISFSISYNSLGFGTLDPESSRYATNDEAGTTEELPAHTLSASTNGFGGYTIYIQGPTLTSTDDPGDTITAMGDPGGPPLAGTKQFGVRGSAVGGDGYMLPPYDDSVFYAYGASTDISDDLASDPNSDDVPTEYSIYYVANISGDTKMSTYSTNITYLIVSNF